MRRVDLWRLTCLLNLFSSAASTAETSVEGLKQFLDKAKKQILLWLDAVGVSRGVEALVRQYEDSGIVTRRVVLSDGISTHDGAISGCSFVNGDIRITDMAPVTVQRIAPSLPL
ncbi:MAG: hypothetical protein OEZ43_14420 [Gammaproteobacteria bacterium]|nr:hypothetical protein [Gammaproteobacteria bacterium]